MLQKIATSDSLFHRVFSFDPFLPEIHGGWLRKKQCGLEVNFPDPLATQLTVGTLSTQCLSLKAYMDINIVISAGNPFKFCCRSSTEY